MSLVVGRALDSDDDGAEQLGAVLARSLGEPLALVGVLTHRWSLAPSRSDVSQTGAQRGAATALLDAARAALPDDVRATRTLRLGRSVPTELHEEALESDARFLVLGSAADAVRGRIALGSVSDRVLHSAPVPVAVAPRGYRAPVDARVPRVTVAVDGGPRSAGVLAAATALAVRARVGVRLVTFAIRRRAMFPPELGLAIEDDVVAAWCDQAREGQDRAVASVYGDAAPVPEAGAAGAAPDGAGGPGLAPLVERTVAVGRSWEHAVAELDWLPGELLVIGSSSDSPLTRVFLGSTAGKLLRAAETPVVVVPQ